MYVVYINLLYFLSIFLFTYNKNLLSPQKKYAFATSNISNIFINIRANLNLVMKAFLCISISATINNNSSSSIMWIFRITVSRFKNFISGNAANIHGTTTMSSGYMVAVCVS